MGEGVTGSLGQAVRASRDGRKIRPAVVAAAGLDSQLAPDGEQLGAAWNVAFTERQAVEQRERVAGASSGQENLDS